MWERSVLLVFGRIRPVAWSLQCRLVATTPSENVTEQTESSQSATQEKVIKVAIIGVPNAGKSTLINSLIEHKVCPTSSKVHTTRKTARAIQSKSNSQVILFDTPGLVGERDMKRHQLDTNFLSACRQAMQSSNLIGVVHDVSNSWTRHALNPILLQVLQEHSHVPSFLILNKIDVLKSKRILLDIVKTVTNDRLDSISNYVVRKRKNPPLKKVVEIQEGQDRPVGWSHFSEVFMVSAVTGDGLHKLMSFIHANAKQGSWEHLADERTDQSPEQLIVQSVRARLLDFMPQEIPYRLTTEIEYFEVIDRKYFASVIVTCPIERHERLLRGESNGKLRQIIERVTSDLIETFALPVVLTITTRVQSKDE